MKIRSFEECVTCFKGISYYLDFHMGSVQLRWDRSQVSFSSSFFRCLLRAKKERSWKSELPVLERVGWMGGNEILLVGDGI